MEGWKPVSANLFEAIRRRKEISLDRFIYALGVNEVGEATAKLLARNYISISNFLHAVKSAKNRDSEDYKHLKNINGIGPIVADKILGFFASPQNISILDDILSQIRVTDFRVSQTTTSQLAGKTIVFTGALETMTRPEAKAKAESLGAIVTGDVSKKTDFVIAGPGAGSNERKAKQLGIPLLSEAEWLEMLRAASI
jgi:DNA ligase (NAD+)